MESTLQTFVIPQLKLLFDLYFFPGINPVDSALESAKSQLSNAPQIKSTSSLVDVISQYENGLISDIFS